VTGIDWFLAKRYPGFKESKGERNDYFNGKIPVLPLK
jgi:hypothetical protein